MQHKKYGEETWTDLSNAKIEIIPKKNGSSYSYSVKIDNANLDVNSYYWIYFHNKSEDITIDKIVGRAQVALHDGETENTITLFEHILEKNGDIYVSIAQQKSKGISNDNKILIESQKIERPDLFPVLGERVHIYFSRSNTSTYLFAPHNNKLARTIRIKVGKINDIEILKQIKENKPKALENLLSYAKKNKGSYTGTIIYDIYKTSGIAESLTSKMNLENGEYYFAYIELDDENGAYYPVEDISLYYAKNTTDLIRYPKKEFVWNIKEDINNSEQEEPKQEYKEEEPKQEPIENTIKDTTNNIEENNKQEKEDTTKAKGVLPQTGEKAIQVIVVLMIVLAAIGYYKYRQYKDIK